MMPEMHDEALDALLDLSHDLGKYLGARRFLTATGAEQ